jgi:SPP1 gp7 family putative phage head morphogenesis protein
LKVTSGGNSEGWLTPNGNFGFDGVGAHAMAVIKQHTGLHQALSKETGMSVKDVGKMSSWKGKDTGLANQVAFDAGWVRFRSHSGRATFDVGNELTSKKKQIIEDFLFEHRDVFKSQEVLIDGYGHRGYWHNTFSWNDFAENDFKIPRAKVVNSLTQNVRWSFQTTLQKLEAFKKWLKGEVVKDIISEAHKTDDDWWTAYIQKGFEKGAGRTFDDVKKKGMIPQEKMPGYEGTKEQFLQSAFARPVSIEKVKLLAGRVYTDLVGVTDVMSTTLARTLTDGLVQGKSPREIARDINKNISQIGQRRAEAIARTEIIRSHAEGQLHAMENLGISHVTAAVEWATAGDAKVCPLCRPLNGLVLKLSEAKNMIPRHPNCRCAWEPANVGEDQKGQLRTPGQIKKALKKSLGKSKTVWFGAGKKFSKVRPKNLTMNTEANCGIGPGGFKPGNTCAKGDSIPKIPHFISSNKTAVEANITASKEMRALAQAGALDALKNHPGTPSPKVQEYKKQLLQTIQVPTTSPKIVPQVAPMKSVPPSSMSLSSALDQVVAGTGYSAEQLKNGLGHDLTMRAKVTDHILSQGIAVKNAVQGITLGDEAKVKSLTQGDTAGPLKEFADTPKYDIAVLSSIKVSKEALPEEALASLDVGYIKVGSTTRPGSYRHELGHVIHGTYTHRAKGVAVDKAVEKEFAIVQEKVKANPIGLKTKQEHEWYEKEYGVVGRRCLDNSKENFAEQYRVYHREIYRDKHEGGGGKFLEGYRTRHPGWAKLFDAHYTTALIHETLNKG